MMLLSFTLYSHNTLLYDIWLYHMVIYNDYIMII